MVGGGGEEGGGKSLKRFAWGEAKLSWRIFEKVFRILFISRINYSLLSAQILFEQIF